MATIHINGLAYYYTTAGNPHEGQPPLLLLHGFTGSAASWAPVMGALAPAYFSVAVDLLGHGQTAAPADLERYAMSSSAADLAALIRAITTPPVNLLGYSMGGRLALYFALKYPHLVHKLILESASPGLATAAERQQRQQSDDQLADRIEREGVEAFVNFWEQLPLFASQKQLPPSVQARQRAQRLQNRPLGLANSLRGMGTGAQPPLWERLAELIMPTLLLAGELDTKFVAIAQAMAKSIPQAQMKLIANTGHTIHLEQTARFIQEVILFMTPRPLTPLMGLTETELIGLTKSMLAPQQQIDLQRALEQNRDPKLTQQQRQALDRCLDQLIDEVDQVALHKAQALYTLKRQQPENET